MNFPWYIAKRFMLGGSASGPSRFSGWISILGMASGCFAMVVAVAVLRGFEQRVTEKLALIEGDLRISGLTYKTDYSQVKSILESEQAIDAFTPFIERKGFIESQSGSQSMVTLKAVNVSKLKEVYGLDVADQDGDAPKIFLGKQTAQRLNVGEGFNVSLMSPVDQALLFGLPKKVEAEIGGIFQTDVLDYDDRLAFIPLNTGQSLFTRKPDIEGVDIRLKSGVALLSVQERLDSHLPGELTVHTWKDFHSGLVGAMQMERIGALAVLSLIIVVAGFNLASTLFLVTVQKTRELGMLRAMGASRDRIKRIIFSQGTLIGGAGISAGLLLGLSFVAIQNKTGFIPLPEEIYFLNSVPMLLNPMDVGVVIVISMTLAFLFTVLAAKRSNRLRLRDAIWYEK